MVDMIDANEAKAGIQALRSWSGMKYTVWATAGAACAYFSLRWLGETGAGTYVGAAGAAVVAYRVNVVRKMLKNGDADTREGNAKTAATDAALADDDRKKELADTVGFIIGAESRDPKSRLYKFMGETSFLTIAASGSGKTVQLIANLLVPEGVANVPCVVSDPQGEIYPIVARRRIQLGRKVVLLDPLGKVAGFARNKPYLKIDDIAASNHFNMMDLIDIADEDGSISIANYLCETFLINDQAGGGGDAGKYFLKMARMLFRAAILYIAATKTGEERTLAGVYNFLNEHTRDAMVALWRADPNLAHRIPFKTANELADMKAEQYASIRSTLAADLEWVDLPRMREHMSYTDFDIWELSQNKLDVFYGVDINESDVYNAWYRMWMLIPSLVLSKHPAEVPVIAPLDEVVNAGKNPRLASAVRTMRKAGLIYWPIIQDIPGYFGAFGETDGKSIMNSCQVVQFAGFGRADLETAEFASKLSGTKHYLQESHSSQTGTSGRPDDLIGTGSKSDSVSTSYQKDDILPVHVLLNMPAGEIINFVSYKKGLRHPLKCFSVAYYDRPEIECYAGKNPYRAEVEGK